MRAAWGVRPVNPPHRPICLKAPGGCRLKGDYAKLHWSLPTPMSLRTDQLEAILS